MTYSKNLKSEKKFSIPENPLTTKVGQRKLGRYKIAVYMSIGCLFITFKEVCVCEKIVHQIQVHLLFVNAFEQEN